MMEIGLMKKYSFHHNFTRKQNTQRCCIFLTLISIDILNSRLSNHHLLIITMPNYLCSGLICMHSSVDTEDIMAGCVFKEEFLCCTRECCVAANAEPLGCGLVDGGEGSCCNLALYCLACGLKSPSTCCAGADQLLCLKSACSCPFDKDYVEKPVCAICFVSCVPEVGIFKEAPTVAAMKR
jgi:hypothetical protein